MFKCFANNQVPLTQKDSWMLINIFASPKVFLPRGVGWFHAFSLFVCEWHILASRGGALKKSKCWSVGSLWRYISASGHHLREPGARPRILPKKKKMKMTSLWGNYHWVIVTQAAGGIINHNSGSLYMLAVCHKRLLQVRRTLVNNGIQLAVSHFIYGARITMSNKK